MARFLAQHLSYTYYSADIAFRIKRKHTLRLYWLVCSWRSRGGLTLPLSQLRTLLGLGSAYDRPDNIVTHVLTAAGLSFRLLDDIFPRIRPEDLPAFVQKLQSLLLTLSARRDLRNPAAYIHKALESWL